MIKGPSTGTQNDTVFSEKTERNQSHVRTQESKGKITILLISKLAVMTAFPIALSTQQEYDPASSSVVL